MKKFGFLSWLLIIFLSLPVFKAYAASNDNLREELAGLIKQRQTLFEAYSASLEKKSGFFGNKTKNDLRDSHARLVEIVEADNKIMSVLNRTVDFRNFEKQNLTFDATSNSQRIQNLTALNESLIKQNEIHAKEIIQYKSQAKKYRLYNVLIISLLLVIASFRFVRKYFRA